ncbi:unnamed protein product [Paramecium sonneborni]|uniref:Uncharacterized protein n=1 Tax=Paramecium sonneborni TaxID=65129 RepID=A0A8S1PC58_9CILI|nr:unnamed protein product [Paramecium sonneborni]
MKNSQKYCILGQFLENSHFMPSLNSFNSKVNLKTQLITIRESEDIKKVQKNQISGKQQEVIQDNYKRMFKKYEGSIHSYRSPQNCVIKGNTQIKETDLINKVSSRLLSPKQQKEVIEYLQKKNEQLVEENIQKQQIINRLMGTDDNQKRIKQFKLCKGNQILPQIPKSVESKRNKGEEIRFRQIKTPEQQIDDRKSRIDILKEQIRNEQQNIFNVSFGNKMEQNEAPCKIKRVNFLDKRQSHPIQSAKKLHFQKLLQKLPQEFHLEIEYHEQIQI